MRKIFIDIGSHNGQTLAKAVQFFPPLSLYIGVEPIKALCDQTMAKIPAYYKDRVLLCNYALDYQAVPEKMIDFYEDIGRSKLGSSLLPDKRINRKQKIQIKSVDIRTFLAPYHDDLIILKVDIEGKEYDIFKGMLKHNLFHNVQSLFVEWHQHKVASISQETHDTIVKQIQALGRYNITGRSKDDEFYRGL